MLFTIFVIISNLVKKTDYDIKITEIENKPIDHDHDKNITTPEFINLAARVLLQIKTSKFSNKDKF